MSCFMSCLVISGFILKSNSFPVLFWIVTLLSFQVTCPSSCVTGLIVFPDSWLCPPVPSSPMCSYSLRLPSSCASVSSYVFIPALILEYWTIAIVTLASCLLSIPQVVYSSSWVIIICSLLFQCIVLVRFIYRSFVFPPFGALLFICNFYCIDSLS